MQLPTWVKALAIYGSPTIVTLYFTWWITGVVAKETRDTNDLLRPHIAASEEILRTMKTIANIQTIQCVNGASSDAERRACVRAGTETLEH